MKLSKRLSTIAGMIPTGVRVIDVGCDHALLDIYLTKNKKNHCIASDINTNVLAKTKEIIKSYSIENEILVIQSDGLEKIDIKPSDTIVIAGMGASTILHILEQKFSNHLVIQSNNDLELIRRKIVEKGFYIDQEQVVYEKGIYYVIMSFQKGESCYSEKELLFGPILLADSNMLTMSYFQDLLRKKERIVSQIPSETEEKQKFLKEIQYLHEMVQ